MFMSRQQAVASCADPFITFREAERIRDGKGLAGETRIACYWAVIFLEYSPELRSEVW